MAHDELIKEFNELVEEYAKHRDYIDKAKAQAAKFSAAVIEKVILDHEIKSAEVADKVLPHVPSLQEAIAGIDAEKEQINADKAGSDEKMEELQLRAAIGELEDGEFEELSAELKETLENAAGLLEALDADRGSLQAALDRWVELAIGAGQDAGVAEGEPEPEPEPEAEAEADVEDELEVEADGGDETILDEDEPGAEDELIEIGDEPVAAEPAGEHVAGSGMREDVSAVFEDSPAAEAEAAAGDDDALIEVGEVGEDAGDMASSDVDFGFDDGDDFLAEDQGAEVQLDLVEEHGDADEDIAVDLAEEEVLSEAGAAEEGDESRRALLLYQEGTAEEQIYPFTGDVLTIGRGRDNDIQIKNDSKVSRFHCRLFKRSGNFYIEDNKSSNGTLVNGELITERRLFGGEEVIIGETFFRFRIM